MAVTTPHHVPADVQELIEIVQNAQANGTPLQVMGGDSKQSVGFPHRATTVISTLKFDRVIDYDPAELVMTVESGVRLTMIQQLLAQNNQMLAFDPSDFADAVGAIAGASTIGGIVAAGLAGSRRLSAGNVRDHVLGFTAVSGRGERFVAGGRVVKNVTGYDLPKLMCGSWGQLAMLTEITLKVLPRPRVTLTLSVRGLDDELAFTAMTRAVRSQCEVAAAAYLPRGVIDQQSRTLLRLEGFGPSVESRARALTELLMTVSSGGTIDRASEHESCALWSAIPARLAHADRMVKPVLWRICVPSTAGVGVCVRLRQLSASFCVDWAGGLMWVRTAADVDGAQLRNLAESVGGHATLLDAPVDYRSHMSAQHPESSGVAALAQRVKAAFDPAGILDPLRFAEPGA
ncbi:MAG TPA: FAD-binding protein [Steroidobacteraceae bacterium]|nr:FAD-binding protein [Steroidobacteraceae bacterium]